MLCDDDDDEEAELMRYVAKAKGQVADLRKHIQVLVDPSHDWGDGFNALLWQSFIVGEMDALLAAMEMRITGAAVH